MPSTSAAYALTLKAIRDERGITAKRIADALKIDKSQVSRLDRGERDLSLAEFVTYAGVLGIKPGDLLDHSYAPADEEFNVIRSTISGVSGSKRAFLLTYLNDMASKTLNFVTNWGGTETVGGAGPYTKVIAQPVRRPDGQDQAQNLNHQEKES